MQNRTFHFTPVYHTSDGRRWATSVVVDVVNDEFTGGGLLNIDTAMQSGAASRRAVDAGTIAVRETLHGTRSYQFLPGTIRAPRHGLWRRTVREAAQDAASHSLGNLARYGVDR